MGGNTPSSFLAGVALWIISKANLLVGDNNKVYVVGLVLLIFGFVQLLAFQEYEAGSKNIIDGFGIIFLRHTFSKVYTKGDVNNG